MKEHSDDNGGQGGVKSADRVLHLLEILSTSGEDRTSAQLAAQTEIPRSSLHALLRTLQNRDWVQETSSGTYALAPTALTVGISYLDHDRAVVLTTSRLERARDRIGRTVNLARLIDGEVVYLAIREGADRRNLPSRLGRRLPAFATALGRVLLAELSVHQSHEILGSHPRKPLTAHTVTDLDELTHEIDLTRGRGYGLERAQTLEDVACVAVALPYRMPATDAISCSMPIDEATEERIAEVAAILQEEAADAARELRQLGVR